MKTTVTVVKLEPLLNEMQLDQCRVLGLEPDGNLTTLPDGNPSIYTRMRNLVSQFEHGEQQFHNDSIFVYRFPETDMTVGEPQCVGDEKFFYNACYQKSVITVNGYNHLVYLET